MNNLLDNFEKFWDNNCKDILYENKQIDLLLYLYFHLGEIDDE